MIALTPSFQPRVVRKNKAERLGMLFHIKPSLIVARPWWEGGSNGKNFKNRLTDANLKDNKHSLRLSKQSQKKIRTAIDWLVAAASPKTITCSETGQQFSFKINFITLTLPAFGSHITVNNFYKELVHPFLAYCRKYFKLNNYVWKIELQDNGNPHLHLTSDTYIHWKRIRSCWNRILLRKQVLPLYTAKHAHLSFADYLSLYPVSKLVSLQQRQQAYDYGVSTNWADPNTTDVHAVKGLKDIAAYLCKYMAKDLVKINTLLNDDLSETKTMRFRSWGCNQELSSMRSITVAIGKTEFSSGAEALYSGGFKGSIIEGNSEYMGRKNVIAQLFYIKPQHWVTSLKGVLQDAFYKAQATLQKSFLKPLDKLLSPVPEIALSL